MHGAHGGALSSTFNITDIPQTISRGYGKIHLGQTPFFAQCKNSVTECLLKS